MSLFSRSFAIPLKINQSLVNRFSLHARFATASPAKLVSAHDQNVAIVDKSINEAEALATKYNKYVEGVISRWNKCNETYYGKERDLVNYPTVKIAQQHPKVRMGFIPDTWFQALYSRTGVTGPYLFLAGTTTFLLSKEIWVIDAHFNEIIPFVLIMTWMIKKFGPRASEYLDKYTQQRIDNFYTKPMKNAAKYLDATVESANEEIARTNSVPLLATAKKENLDLQLEMHYRERLQQVYKTVTRRLDYHAERENVRRRFQQHHMANWITDAVVSGITPAQEQATLRQCIDDLKAMASQQQQQHHSSPATA